MSYLHLAKVLARIHSSDREERECINLSYDLSLCKNLVKGNIFFSFLEVQAGF